MKSGAKTGTHNSLILSRVKIAKVIIILLKSGIKNAL
jgi:hypothetical protein